MEAGWPHNPPLPGHFNWPKTLLFRDQLLSQQLQLRVQQAAAEHLHL